MKIALKNFLTTLRRYKAASALNIVGLTLAFAAFYVIASQIWYSLTYNRAIDDADRIYLLTPMWNAEDPEHAVWSANCPLPVTRETIGQLPEAELGTFVKLYSFPSRVWTRRNDYHFEKFGIGVSIADTTAVDLFSFRTVAGDLKGFGAPNTLIVSRSAAEQMQVGIGDPIFLEGGEWFDSGNPEQSYTVVGIFEDFPQNTILNGRRIFRCDHGRDGETNNNWNYTLFVRLRAGSDPQRFVEAWEQRYAAWRLGMMEKWRERNPDFGYEEGDEHQPLRLVALDRMYYGDRIDSSNLEQGSVAATATLVAIAVAIVVIAFINFVNFFLALVPVRIRAVNICKVFGADRGTLRRSFLFEAVGLAGIAMLLALYLMVAVQESPIASLVDPSLALADNLPVIALIGAILTAMAVTAAVYPALYITRFNASLAVRAGFAGSHSGRMLRSLLIGVQFVVSTILIILSGVFVLQYRHMLREDIGFDRENVLTFEDFDLRNHSEALIGKLERYPDAAGVTASFNSILGSSSIWGREYKGKQFQLYVWDVRYNLPEVLGIGMVGGETFTLGSADRSEMIVTEKLHREIGLGPDEEVNGIRVRAVMQDLRLLPVSDPAVYTAFRCSNSNGFFTFYLRLRKGADIEAACDYIRKTVAELAPDVDAPSVELLDASVARFYATTRRQTIVITLFALLSVVISLMGVFGIILFETQHRRSEIALRKVFGASTAGLIAMLNRRYAAIVLLCFVVAAPVAALVAERWLTQFASRIDLPLWLFAAAGAAVLVLTVALVTLRSRSVANENPSHVMKTN